MGISMHFPAADAPERPAPLWARMLGKRHHDTSYRFSWGELSVRRTGLAFNFACYETPHLNIAIGFMQVFISLPMRLAPFFGGDGFGETKSWGFTSLDGNIHLHWGHRLKIIWSPNGWEFDRRQLLLENGEWWNYIRPGHAKQEQPMADWSAEFPYHYMTIEGEAQHVTATVRRVRHFTRRKVLGVKLWTKVKDSIDVSFSEEIGNRRGSWKGGCVGCGYAMKPGETPFRTLRRMQRERSFCR